MKELGHFLALVAFWFNLAHSVGLADNLKDLRNNISAVHDKISAVSKNLKDLQDKLLTQPLEPKPKPEAEAGAKPESPSVSEIATAIQPATYWNLAFPFKRAVQASIKSEVAITDKSQKELEALEASEFKNDEIARKIFVTRANDPYGILGIRQGEDFYKVRKAYRQLAKKYSASGVEVSQIRRLLFEKIDNAYKLIGSAQDPNKKDADGRTALHLALQAQLPEDEITFLLNMGADPNLTFNLELENAPKLIGITPFYMAAANISNITSRVIQILLERGANPFSIIQHVSGNFIYKGTTFDFMTEARDYKHLEAYNITKKYEEKKITEAIASHHSGPSDLCIAAMFESMDLVSKLISSGVNVDAVDESGRTALCYAVNNNDDKMVNLLLRNKANPNCNYPNIYPKSIVRTYEYKLIHAAVKLGFESIIKSLLESGANPNEEAARTLDWPEYLLSLCPWTTTPLIVAIDTKKPMSVLDILVKHGAKIDQPVKIDTMNEYGKIVAKTITPLEFAQFVNNKDAVTFLKK